MLGWRFHHWVPSDVAQHTGVGFFPDAATGSARRFESFGSHVSMWELGLNSQREGSATLRRLCLIICVTHRRRRRLCHLCLTCLFWFDREKKRDKNKTWVEGGEWNKKTMGSVEEYTTPERGGFKIILTNLFNTKHEDIVLCVIVLFCALWVVRNNTWRWDVNITALSGCNLNVLMAAFSWRRSVSTLPLTPTSFVSLLSCSPSPPLPLLPLLTRWSR